MSSPLLGGSDLPPEGHPIYVCRANLRRARVCVSVRNPPSGEGEGPGEESTWVEKGWVEVGDSGELHALWDDLDGWATYPAHGVNWIEWEPEADG